ncbi:hypothetical protein [Streptomyces rochei]|uniref:hypothetical protein n=1 Tax=Streptomyces rochei TaxID=1928 RepID=UPI0033A07385
MSDLLWGLLKDTARVQGMLDEIRVTDAAGTTTPEKEREYRLRRAALAQRHLAAAADTGSDPVQAQEDAVRTAQLLWQHDVQHESSLGPIPPCSPVWGSRGLDEYVRQEAAAAGLATS